MPSEFASFELDESDEKVAKEGTVDRERRISKSILGLTESPKTKFKEDEKPIEVGADETSESKDTIESVLLGNLNKKEVKSFFG